MKSLGKLGDINHYSVVVLFKGKFGPFVARKGLSSLELRPYKIFVYYLCKYLRVFYLPRYVGTLRMLGLRSTIAYNAYYSFLGNH